MLTRLRHGQTAGKDADARDRSSAPGLSPTMPGIPESAARARCRDQMTTEQP
jgi:hypothetical protein